jgi:hypothetical protein
MAVAGGGAFTGGVNRLPPVGLMLFSVGVTGGATDVVVVVVVVVVVLDGLGLLLVPQPAVNPPIAIRAAPPAIAPRRRGERPDIMLNPLCAAIGRFSMSWPSAKR